VANLPRLPASTLTMLTILRPRIPTQYRPEMRSDLIRRVLGDYGEPFASADFAPWPSTGLSGARFWRSDIGAGRYVLRRWPDGQLNGAKIAWIHRRLAAAYDQGCQFVAVPLMTSGGETFVAADHTFWQLEPWMPGSADLLEPPRFEKVAATTEALAQFHRATCPAVDATPAEVSTSGRSPSLLQRAELLEEMLAGGIDLIRNAPAFVAPVEPWAGIAMTALPWLSSLWARAAAMNIRLLEALTVPLPLQPVVRDATREHFLFTGDVVTGLVDFGAMAEDHVTVDLARLAGSYGGDPSIVEQIWRTYAASKHALRLTDFDRRLIDLLDQSGVLIAPYRWLRWIFVEERRFADPQAVARRIGKLITRNAAL
jgi:Ser/Thr protein kinase RdoA (MazF antagonist)